MLNYCANGPAGYNLSNSLRFRGSASGYLNRTPASSGNRKTWTWSAWVKRGSLGGTYNELFGVTTGASDASFFVLTFGANGNADTLGLQGWTTNYRTTTQLFRDPSAWYHIVCAVDTTQATASNRIKLYVNGSEITSFSINNNPAQNTDFLINSTSAHTIARDTQQGVNFDGYMTEINFIDGQALTPSSFGSTNSTTGVWQPAKYTGTYGTNGFYLNFSNIALTSGSNTGLGKDYSGNGNYWNTNNISVTSGTTYDSMTDVPTLTSATVANYCVWNPLKKPLTGSYSNGNLTVVGGTDTEAFGTMAYPSTGSFYFEYLVASTGGGGFGPQVGICTLDGNYTVKYFRNGYKGVNGTNTAYGGAWALNDIIGIAYNASTNTVTFYKNNVSQGDITASSGQEYFPYFFDNSSSTHNFTFGQRPFTYTPPTNFVALNTYNLPISTIVQGNKYMDATLYTGNGSTQTITNAASFRPDFVWIKNRSSTRSHLLYDSVRGAGLVIQSNTTNAEQGNSGDLLASFNSNGFTVNNTFAGGTNDSSNGSGLTFVGWQWQAGQGTTSSNTSGSITSTVSVNATAGFSIIRYTGNATSGATIGHGLGVAPKMVIVKNLPNTYAWVVYTASTGNTGALFLEQTTGFTVNSVYWNNTSPTSSVITLGNTVSTNGSGNSHIAYAWSEISGFSKFGSYTGNSNSDGVFIYTGFRPTYVLVKRTDAVENWVVFDNARNPYNVEVTTLEPNLSAADSSSPSNAAMDILSNGFKLRCSAGINAGTWIYMAFAENPFKNALAR